VYIYLKQLNDFTSPAVHIVHGDCLLSGHRGAEKVRGHAGS
jgi:hypothetical protein